MIMEAENGPGRRQGCGAVIQALVSMPESSSLCLLPLSAFLTSEFGGDLVSDGARRCDRSGDAPETR